MYNYQSTTASLVLLAVNELYSALNAFKSHHMPLNDLEVGGMKIVVVLRSNFETLDHFAGLLRAQRSIELFSVNNLPTFHELVEFLFKEIVFSGSQT
jgi:hypothetical protein